MTPIQQKYAEALNKLFDADLKDLSDDKLWKEFEFPKNKDAYKLAENFIRQRNQAIVRARKIIPQKKKETSLFDSLPDEPIQDSFI